MGPIRGAATSALSVHHEQSNPSARASCGGPLRLKVCRDNDHRQATIGHVVCNLGSNRSHGLRVSGEMKGRH